MPDVDAVVAEFLPIVKERRNREALHLGMRRLAHREGFEDVIEHMKATERLGERKVISGIDIGPKTLQNIRRVSRSQRLPTGVPELDQELGGGVRTETISIVMGDSGDGKSMFLTHVAGSAVVRGVNTLVATLELDDVQWTHRLLANLTGVPIDAIEDRSMERECEERLAELELGRCRVEQFTAGATKVDDIEGAFTKDGFDANAADDPGDAILPLPVTQQTPSRRLGGRASRLGVVGLPGSPPPEVGRQGRPRRCGGQPAQDQGERRLDRDERERRRLRDRVRHRQAPGREAGREDLAPDRAGVRSRLPYHHRGRR